MHNDLDVVSLMEFTIFVNDDKGDVIFPHVMSEVLWDMVEAAV